MANRIPAFMLGLVTFSAVALVCSVWALVVR
jgi:hypothetical protein